MSETEKMAEELMDEQVKHPSLDRFLDRHPRTMAWPGDYTDLVGVLRQDRAMFIQGEQEKRDKKGSK